MFDFLITIIGPALIVGLPLALAIVLSELMQQRQRAAGARPITCICPTCASEARMVLLPHATYLTRVCRRHAQVACHPLPKGAA
jgi:hypothetical protein